MRPQRTLEIPSGCVVVSCGYETVTYTSNSLIPCPMMGSPAGIPSLTPHWGFPRWPLGHARSQGALLENLHK